MPRNDPVSLTVSSAQFEDPRFVRHLVNRYRDLGWSVDFQQTGTRIALTLTVRDLDVIGAKQEPPVQRPAVLGPNDVLQRVFMVNGKAVVELKLPAQFSFEEAVDLPLASTADAISNHPAVVRFLFNTYRSLGWDVEVAKASPIAIFRVRFPAGQIPTTLAAE